MHPKYVEFMNKASFTSDYIQNIIKSFYANRCGMCYELQDFYFSCHIYSYEKNSRYKSPKPFKRNFYKLFIVSRNSTDLPLLFSNPFITNRTKAVLINMTVERRSYPLLYVSKIYPILVTRTSVVCNMYGTCKYSFIHYLLCRHIKRYNCIVVG